MHFEGLHIKEILFEAKHTTFIIQHIQHSLTLVHQVRHTCKMVLICSMSADSTMDTLNIDDALTYFWPIQFLGPAEKGTQAQGWRGCVFPPEKRSGSNVLGFGKDFSLRCIRNSAIITLVLAGMWQPSISRSSPIIALDAYLFLDTEDLYNEPLPLLREFFTSVAPLLCPLHSEQGPHLYVFLVLSIS